MSATATGLLEQARQTLVDLQHTPTPVTRQQWASFDQTLYRLLHELVRTRTGWLATSPQALSLYRAFRDYPRPLQPADDRADYSLKETARFLGTTDPVIRKRVRNGVMLAASTAAGYRIPRSELVLGEEPRPASTTDCHALARVACTLGALTDLLVINRLEPHLPELEAESAAWIGKESLMLTAGAARRVLSLCEPEIADRPLTIARYAANAAASIATCVPPTGLQDPAVAPPIATAASAAALLASSIHQWAAAARHDLRAHVPSVEVLKDINRQGIHIYAVLDSILSRFSPSDDALQEARGQLRSSAHALQRGVDAWSQTTTGAPPSREYVEASRRLYTELANASRTATLQPDSAAMYQALHRGANEVAWVTSLATPSASRLLQSEVLFVHARHARNDTQRLTDAIAGRMVIARPDDVPDLFSHAWEAERSASKISRSLPTALPDCYALQTAALISEL